jgi:putative ABC transport system ATP-binding protein
MSLDIVNVKKSFFQAGEEIKVLKGVQAKLNKGEVVAVVGQSGSGKSTLLSLLAGLDLPDSGDILINGESIAKKNQDEMTVFRGQHIGIVFQQFHLMSHLTALENVMLPMEILGRTDLAEKKSKEYLELMGLSHRLSHLPSQLSGGECQRVAMARALVVEPDILLADEPSGNLDTETGNKVMNVFFDVVRKKKVTTLLVTHNEALAAACDRKLTLNNGVM